uniref:Uncharacterized protein n=1 Tax=Anopheles maculatus TaxID=74869 RepID=A0A182T1Y7_9DIPT
MQTGMGGAGITNNLPVSSSPSLGVAGNVHSGSMMMSSGPPGAMGPTGGMSMNNAASTCRTDKHATASKHSMHDPKTTIDLNKMSSQFPGINQLPSYAPSQYWQLEPYYQSYNLTHLDTSSQKSPNKFHLDLATSMAYGSFPSNLYSSFQHQEQQYQQVAPAAASSTPAYQPKERNTVKSDPGAAKSSPAVNDPATAASCHASVQQQTMHLMGNGDGDGATGAGGTQPDMKQGTPGGGAGGEHSIGVYTPESTTSNSVQSLHQYGQCDIDMTIIANNSGGAGAGAGGGASGGASGNGGSGRGKQHPSQQHLAQQQQQQQIAHGGNSGTGRQRASTPKVSRNTPTPGAQQQRHQSRTTPPVVNNVIQPI